MSVNIIEAIIPISSRVRPTTNHSKKWIVIHETGNKSKGANAKNHSTYLTNLAKSNNKYLSWHYTVDDSEIYHHIPDNEIAWHAGDGTAENGGNMSGIGIEICVNSDGDFAKAMDNAAWLTAKLLKDNGWSIDRVKQHHDFSSYGKNCPETIRNQGLWGDFIAKTTNYLNQVKGAQNANSVDSKTSAEKLKYKVGDTVYYSSCYSSSTDDVSKALLLSSSYFGGKFRKGTITRVLTNGCHNPYLINNGDCWINDGDIRGYASAATTVSYYPKCKTTFASVSDALKSVGVDGSFSNRSKIAAANSIKNYTGSPVQNTKMLNLLKQGKLIKA